VTAGRIPSRNMLASLDDQRLERSLMRIRIGVQLGYSRDFKRAAEQVVEMEKVGADIVLVPEAYSYDAVSQLGYLAAKTTTIEIGSGILPIYTRTPSLLAMTAAGMDYVLSVDIPWIFTSFWAFAKSWIPEKRRDMVQFCSKAQLLDYFDEENLPPVLGGTCVD